MLLELTHAENIDSFDRSVDVLVSRLRSKMGDTARTPKLIRTVRGGGYMFVETVSTTANDVARAGAKAVATAGSAAAALGALPTGAQP
jgi:two-component system OmpR family response regulator